MKKFIALLACLMLVGSVTGCKEKKTDTKVDKRAVKKGAATSKKAPARDAAKKPAADAAKKPAADAAKKPAADAAKKPAPRKKGK